MFHVEAVALEDGAVVRAMKGVRETDFIEPVYQVKDGVAGVIHTDPVMVPATAPARKALSYEEFIALARKHYTRGGDVAVECWEKDQFDYYVKEFGPVTAARALVMFRQWKSQEEEQEVLLSGNW